MVGENMGEWISRGINLYLRKKSDRWREEDILILKIK